MEIYHELQLLALLPRPDGERRILLRAAHELMPAEARLIARVSEYVDEAALVSDVVTKLGLRSSQSVVVGKALKKLGFKRMMVCRDEKTYPLWVRPSCKYPKWALHKILMRNAHETQ